VVIFRERVGLARGARGARLIDGAVRARLPSAAFVPVGPTAFPRRDPPVPSGDAMTRLVLAAVAALLVPVTARAVPPGPGVLCGLVSTTDPMLDDGAVQTGFVFAGPAGIVDATSGTLVCTVQVGVATHDGLDDAGAGVAGAGVVALAPTMVSYNLPPHVPVYYCSAFVPDGGGPTLYWADTNDPTVLGAWSTSAGVSCGLAVEVDAGDPARLGHNTRMIVGVPPHVP
jgi:hypothetical protein